MAPCWCPQGPARSRSALTPPDFARPELSSGRLDASGEAADVQHSAWDGDTQGCPLSAGNLHSAHFFLIILRNSFPHSIAIFKCFSFTILDLRISLSIYNRQAPLPSFLQAFSASLLRLFYKYEQWMKDPEEAVTFLVTRKSFQERQIMFFQFIDRTGSCWAGESLCQGSGFQTGSPGTWSFLGGTLQAKEEKRKGRGEVRMGVLPPSRASNPDILLLSALHTGLLQKIPVEIEMVPWLYFLSHWKSGKTYSQSDWLNGGKSFL